MTNKKAPLTKGRKVVKKPARRPTALDQFVCGWEMGLKRGLAESKAEAVLAVLKYRHVSVSSAVRSRVLDNIDWVELDEWFDRAFTVDKAKELFDSPPAPGRRRSEAAPARSARTRTRTRTHARPRLQLVSW